MPDTLVGDTTDGNVYFHVNDDGASTAGNKFALWTTTAAHAVFEVREAGDISPAGKIERVGTLLFNNSDGTASIVARFSSGGVPRLNLKYASNQVIFETPALSDSGITLASTSTLGFVADHDADSSPNHLRIQAGASDRMVVGDDSSTSWYDGGGALHASFGISGSDVELVLGNNADGIQGMLCVERDDRAGVIVLQRENGTQCFLWVYGGVLRIVDSFDPGTYGESSGVSVGSQT